MMDRLLTIVALLALPALSWAQEDVCPSGVTVIEQGGCLVTGSGQGGVLRAACAYEALDEEQTVLVATPNPWKVFVRKLCPEKPFGCTWTYSDGGCIPDPETAQGSCAPVTDDETGETSLVCSDVILASGTGPPAGLPAVNPEVGEVVIVEIEFMIAGPASGSWGALASGLEDQP